MTQVKAPGSPAVAQTGPAATEPQQSPAETAGPAIIRPATPPQAALTGTHIKAMRTAVQNAGGILLLDNFAVDGKALGRKTDLTPEEARALQAVIEGIGQIKDAFAELDTLDPELLKKIPLNMAKTAQGRDREEIERAAAIVDAAFAQLDTLDRLLETLEKTLGATPTSQNLRDACMARLCELSRFIGTMQAEGEWERQQQANPGENAVRDFAPIRLGAGIRDTLADLAITMHGNDIATREIAADAERLFTDWENLRETFKYLAPGEAKEGLDLIQADIRKLEGVVSAILEQSDYTPGEVGLFEAVLGYAKAVADDMKVLRETSFGHVFPQLLRTVFPKVDETALVACDRLPLFMQKPLADFQKIANRHHDAVESKFKKGTLRPNGLKKEAASVYAAYSKGSADHNPALMAASLQIMKQILDGAYIPVGATTEARNKDILDKAARIACNLFHAAGAPRDHAPTEKFVKMASELLKAFLPLSQAPDSMKAPYLQLYETFMQPNLLSCSEGTLREAEEVGFAMERLTNPIPVARYLPLLFEGKAKLSTLLDAAMLNIPPEHLELRPESAITRETEKLGQGGFNTVTLCRCKDRNGQTTELVFKPEGIAREGMESTRFCALGYERCIRTANLNMASCAVAEMLGVPQVQSRTSLGFLDGTFGLFMSRAPGKTASELRRQENGGSAFYATAAKLYDTGKGSAIFADLQRELNHLGWVDALCGQVDRHRNNYLVHIDPQTGGVTVTGIDNDGSFGERLVGPGTVDMTNLRIPPKPYRAMFSPMRERAIIRRCQRASDGRFGMYEYDRTSRKLFLHFDRARTREDYETLSDYFGLNQAFLPRDIDQATYDKLMALTEQNYRKTLKPFLPPPALDAAVSRLKAVQEHAHELYQNGRCRQGTQWGAPSLLREAVAGQQEVQNDKSREIFQDFFSRDFGQYVNPDIALQGGF